jgi:hypothetical protein
VPSAGLKNGHVVECERMDLETYVYANFFNAVVRTSDGTFLRVVREIRAPIREVAWWSIDDDD